MIYIFVLSGCNKKYETDIFYDISDGSEKYTLNELDNLYPIDDVQKFDKNGIFMFLYASYTGTPKISSHYTTDGYMVNVHYNDDYCVEKVDYRLI